ncbi:hypothetical protein V1264_009112 [Littorina saxatilis]|uniref:Uncharacterized protein n=1 Tax=Littorina saxatilis TaxID=31220 RepID=A0AAN9AR12_9CAEN
MDFCRQSFVSTKLSQVDGTAAEQRAEDDRREEGLVATKHPAHHRFNMAATTLNISITYTGNDVSVEPAAGVVMVEPSVGVVPVASVELDSACASASDSNNTTKYRSMMITV